MFAAIWAAGLLAMLAALAGCAAPGEPVARRGAVPRAITDLTGEQRGSAAILTFGAGRSLVRSRKPKNEPLVEVFRAWQAPPQAGQAAPLAPPELILTIPPAVVESDTEDGRVRISVPFTPDDLSSHQGWSATFMVRTGFSERRLSEPSNAVAVPVYPPANPIADLSAKMTRNGIELSWTPPAGTAAGPLPDGIVYRVYRKEQQPPPGAGQSKSAAGVAEFPGLAPKAEGSGTKTKAAPEFEQIGETSSASYADAPFQFGATYVYSVRSVIPYPNEGLESADSNQVTVVPRDVFPPSAPTGLIVAYVPATAGAQAHLDLSWAINPETDIAGYNVYRSEESAPMEPGVPGASSPSGQGSSADGTRGQGAQTETRVNTQLLPAPSFRDNNILPGQRYTYSVTAVDQAGTESARSAPISESVPAQP